MHRNRIDNSKIRFITEVSHQNDGAGFSGTSGSGGSEIRKLDALLAPPKLLTNKPKKQSEKRNLVTLESASDPKKQRKESETEQDLSQRFSQMNIDGLHTQDERWDIIRSFARQEVTNVNEKFQNPEAIDQFMKENHWKIDPKSVNKTFNDSDDKARIKAETHLTNIEHLINYIETTVEPVDPDAVYVHNFGVNENLRIRFPSLVRKIFRNQQV